MPAIEVETGVNPAFSIIWMHGLGADGSDFEAIVPELGLNKATAVRFIFPHAPMIPVTCNGGYVMRAWYDIISLDSTSRSVDEEGIVHSCAAIRKLIVREIERGIPSQRIFIAGFSQGGAIAYTTALTYPEKLAGVICLSAYIPSARLLDEELSDANKTIPIFAAHGTQDDVVSFGLGLRAKETLNARGYQLDWHTYPMPHSVCLEEIIALGKWLQARMEEC